MRFRGDSLNKVRVLRIEPLKVNNRPPFFNLYYAKFSNLAIFYKDNGKTWLSESLLGIITFPLSCYSEIKEEKDDYWGEYDL